MENIWSYQKVYYDNTDVYYLSKADFHWIASSISFLSDLRHSQIQISRKSKENLKKLRKTKVFLKMASRYPEDFDSEEDWETEADSNGGKHHEIIKSKFMMKFICLCNILPKRFQR